MDGVAAPAYPFFCDLSLLFSKVSADFRTVGFTPRIFRIITDLAEGGLQLRHLNGREEAVSKGCRMQQQGDLEEEAHTLSSKPCFSSIIFSYSACHRSSFSRTSTSCSRSYTRSSETSRNRQRQGRDGSPWKVDMEYLTNCVTHNAFLFSVPARLGLGQFTRQVLNAGADFSAAGAF